MKAMITMLVVAVAALATGCGKSSTVGGESGKKLTLTKPGSATISRGSMTKVVINIKRQDLKGDVTISFDKLPKGVVVADTDLKLIGDEGTFTLKASDTADLVENSVVEVKAEGPEGIAVTETFTITVSEKK